MTTTQAVKAADTRKRHTEARKLKEAQKHQERELIKQNLLIVLNSTEATPAERLESSRLLLELERA